MNKVLDKYKEVEDMKLVNLIHIYYKELTKGNGIVNSRFFEVVGYNTETMEKMNLGRHDEIREMSGYELPVKQIQVFEDKSTIIVFSCQMKIEFWNTQTMYLED